MPDKKSFYNIDTYLIKNRIKVERTPGVESSTSFFQEVQSTFVAPRVVFLHDVSKIDMYL